MYDWYCIRVFASHEMCVFRELIAQESKLLPAAPARRQQVREAVSGVRRVFISVRGPAEEVRAARHLAMHLHFIMCSDVAPQFPMRLKKTTCWLRNNNRCSSRSLFEDTAIKWVIWTNQKRYLIGKGNLLCNRCHKLLSYLRAKHGSQIRGFLRVLIQRFDAQCVK